LLITTKVAIKHLKGENLKQAKLKLEEIMTRPALSAKKDTPVKDIAFEIFYGFFSGMPVTDSDGKVIGVVTEIDLLKQIRKGNDLKKIKADEIMTQDPVTVDINTPLDDVLNVMIEKNIIRIPVTEEGRLVGVIARRDILRYYFQPEHFKHFH
jgi:CBS domain-containing protein